MQNTEKLFILKIRRAGWRHWEGERKRERERERERERDLHSPLHKWEKKIQTATYIQVYSQLPMYKEIKLTIKMHHSAVSLTTKTTFCVHTGRNPPTAVGFNGLNGGTNRLQSVLHPLPSMQSLPVSPSSDKTYDRVASNQTGYPGKICNKGKQY